MAHPSSIEDAQTAIALGPPFSHIEGVSSRTAQRAISLGREGICGKASHRRWPCPLWCSVGQANAFVASRLGKGLRLGRSQFGGAHGHRMQAMAQLEAQVPHPLADDLPELLPTGGTGTPAISILFLVLIGQHDLESAPLQVQRHHISSGERACWQGGEEQFVDHALSRETDWTRQSRGGMRGMMT